MWFVLLALCLIPAPTAAEVIDGDPLYIDLQAGVGYHYSTGDYGDRKNTEIHYVPVIVHGDLDAWSVDLTLPYISIRGPRGIFGVVDPGSAEDDDSVSSNSGLGDILLSVGYTVWPWWEAMPFLTVSGRVKFPTASEHDGLGTGQFDFYFAGQAVWTLGRFTPFLEAGYENLGDSSDIQLRDAGRLSAGGSYQALEPLYVGLSFDYGSPTSSSAGQRIDLVPFVTWHMTRAISLVGYATAGLADGSPDAGVGLQLSYRVYTSEP